MYRLLPQNPFVLLTSILLFFTAQRTVVAQYSVADFRAFLRDTEAGRALNIQPSRTEHDEAARTLSLLIGGLEDAEPLSELLIRYHCRLSSV